MAVKDRISKPQTMQINPKLNKNIPVMTDTGGKGTRIGTLSPGTVFNVDMYDKADDYYRIAEPVNGKSNGWIFGGKDPVAKIPTLLYIEVRSTAITPKEAKDFNNVGITKWAPQIDYYSKFNPSDLSDAAKFRSMSGVYGMPYSFLTSVDLPISHFPKNGSEDSSSDNFRYGRKFTEKILVNMSLLLLTPGRPAFMEGFSKKDKSNTIGKILDLGGKGESESALESMLSNKNGKYYTFKFNYAEYYQYVNLMCRMNAKLLNLDKKYYTRDWSKESEKSGIQGFVNGLEYIAFYIEAENQVTESFSNTTKESMLSSAMNKMSDMAKEVDTLLGATMGWKADILNDDKYAQNKEMIDKYLGDSKDASMILERFKSGALTVAAGGQLIFPEIWSDSSYSKSYDVTVKLQSPDGDDESVYNNILVPMWHLLGLVLPMQLGYNGYRTPFLVRGFCKGIFSIDMGIITNMSIRRGGEASWNINGLPTEVEVNFTIKDLYEILSMTNGKDIDMIGKNTAMIDFIANMSGVSINKPELFRKMDIYLMSLGNKVKGAPRTAYLNFNEGIANKLRQTFGY